MADYNEKDWDDLHTTLQTISGDLTLIDHRKDIKALIAKINKLARKRKKAEISEETIKLDTIAKQIAAKQKGELYDQDALCPSSQNLSLIRSRNCYVCKTPYFKIDPHYHYLCEECSDVSRHYRQFECDLSDYTALITGGRIKIGFKTALKLLRMGAQVIITTRFPDDARRRYENERDYVIWSERLHIHGIDLRFLPDIEALGRKITQSFHSLDILINNAAQTIHRPKAFYDHLLINETEPYLLEARPSFNAGASRLSFDGTLGQQADFPIGIFDRDAQQVDKRSQNSWTLKLDQVDLTELVSVHLVNSFAPYWLCATLKPIMTTAPNPRRFIINVSSMEGQFGRKSKTEFHPHTNMSKAALNMMTRTSGKDFARDNIFMTAIDTGWITNENPHGKSEAMKSQGFVPPLDLLDAAARVLFPIYHGIDPAHDPYHSVFLKDFTVYPW